MIVIPQARDRVSIPLVAAGGIADARGMLAAFALGAEAVQMGTRFICTVESCAHLNVKQAIINACASDTLVTGNITGLPVRCLRNRMSEEFAALEKTGKTKMEMAMFGSGKMKQAFELGDVLDGSIMAGQVSGLIHDIPTCAQLIKDMVSHLGDELERINELIKS